MAHTSHLGDRRARIAALVFLAMAAALALAVVGAAPAAATGTPQTVCYYDLGDGTGDPAQADVVTTAGHRAASRSNPSSLHGCAVLLAQNSSNSGYASEWTSALGSVAAAVEDGMVLVFHDRTVAGAPAAIPGLGGAACTRDVSAASLAVDVVADDTSVTDGPGGRITDDTLDRSWGAASHGYCSASTLPTGGRVILSRADPAQGITVSYRHGEGAVVYSTVPLDWYLDQPSNSLKDVYAPNVAQYGVDLLPAHISVDCAAGETVDAAVERIADGGTITVNGTCVESVLAMWPKSFTLQGGAGGGTIQGDRSWVPTVLALDGVAMTLRNVTITGEGKGLAGSTVIADGVTISGNSTTGSGGGISASGTLTLRNSIIEANESDGDGGGMYIGPGAVVVVEDSTFRLNAAEENGGGIHNDGGTLTITNSTVGPDNTAYRGGGLSNKDGTATVIDSVITGNTARFGGGTYSRDGRATLTGSTISGNAALEGGGVYSSRGSVLTITASALSGNSAETNGGGLMNVGTTDLINVTVSGNGASSFGGGMWVYNGRVTARHTTVTENAATGGGGIFVYEGSATISESIVAGNTDTDPTAPNPDCQTHERPIGLLISHGYVLIGDGSGCTYTAGTGDMVGLGAAPIDARLGPLQDNGGPPTHALLAGSPALDRVPAPCGVATDARGVGRPQGAACDIGAFERTPVAHDCGLVDPATGQWHLRDAVTGAVTSFFFGNPGDVPFMGDWDCDGTDTPGLYRQADGFVYLRNSNTQGVADVQFFFGDPGDYPVAGDFNGDGCDTVSIYRASEQRFYIINALGEDMGGLGAAEYSFVFGNPGDAPVTGDWDGDLVTEIGLFRESAGFFYYRATLTTGIADDEFYFGDPGDRFAAGDWGVVDGHDSPAVYRSSTGTCYFKHDLSQGVADSSHEFGEPGWYPVAGVF